MQVVYNSFGGRYSDNPRVIYEALVARNEPATHVWLCDPDHGGSFPSGVETVPLASQESVVALESADVVVSNTHIEVDWAKAPGAVYLQTWHGTPLKQIHHDALWAPAGRVDRLSADVQRWDQLISPNRPSTTWLTGAFRFAGEVLETGYPRNDVLSSPDRHRLRTEVRRHLGIGDDKTVVLYAPTWRDDLAEPEVFPLQLDVEQFTRRLGSDHVLLLRLHYFDSARLGPVTGPGVLDVSRHADISDLYLAADVMVTDYSSTMFDFAVTGKPMLFFTYDLEHYRDTLRGFYFDLVEDAPGPMLETTGELLDALADLAGVGMRYADAYTRFRERFCHLEDGRATERVLERVFPLAAAVDPRRECP